MKKILLLATAAIFISGTALSYAQTTSPTAPSNVTKNASPNLGTRKVCHIKKNKRICKDIPIRPKVEPTKKKDVKKTSKTITNKKTTTP